MKTSSNWLSQQQGKSLKAVASREFTYNPMPEINPDYGWWFSGLVDGEGSFNLGLSSPRRGYHKAYIRPSFHLGLREDDYEILEEASKRLGLHKPLYRERANGNSKPQAELSISSWRGNRRLVDFFDRYPLRSKKKKDYTTWKQAVLLRTEVWGLYTDELHQQFLDLKLKLEADRQYVKPSASIYRR